MSRDPALDAFCAFFNKLDKTCTDQLGNVYTDDIVFQDPLHRIEGLSELETYFAALYTHVEECQFTFHHQQRQGDTAFVTWTMTLRHPRLSGGKAYEVEGCSRLTFAPPRAGSDQEPQKVQHHRDYFDAGELLYERLPGLGWVIRHLKRRAGA
ncbi:MULTISPECIES: nuclear transport factor 2 family protein [Halomonadaceae]|uniref:SnoaL-like protein n=1 Tax=Onishia taeanensis TaxID=284577 RepID=A0A328XGT1_9GAMM|nr:MULTISPECIES: nuclear transport factor 2 family protein [Halomonas]RAR58174.1 SnoaL-like protein [Halomonas taeanensis]